MEKPLLLIGKWNWIKSVKQIEIESPHNKPMQAHGHASHYGLSVWISFAFVDRRRTFTVFQTYNSITLFDLWVAIFQRKLHVCSIQLQMTYQFDDMFIHHFVMLTVGWKQNNTNCPSVQCRLLQIEH